MLNYQQPDARGHFGPYGGTFVAETLIHALDELKAAYEHYRNDPEFVAEYRSELAHFVGRPSPVYHAARLSRETRRRADPLEARRPEPHRARTRSTTPSARRCWPGAWASRA